MLISCTLTSVRPDMAGAKNTAEAIVDDIAAHSTPPAMRGHKRRDSMKPSDLLNVSKSADGKTFRLTAKGDVTHVYVIGSSSHLTSSARPGEQVSTIMVTRSDHYSCLLVLRVYSKNPHVDKFRPATETDLFLDIPPMDVEEKEANINLNENFVPEKGILAQIVCGEIGEYGLRVRIDGKYYTSVVDQKHSDEIHVPDSTLLTSYVNGDVPADDVIAVAEAHVAEVTAREQLEKLKTKNEALRRVLERGEGNTPVLCFVSGNNAYFTTQDVSRQTGDKWHIGPHTENAGMPNVAPRSILTRPAWDIVRVTWTGPFNVVTHFEDKPLSADDINAMKAPWLEGTKNPHESIGPLLIFAGTHLDRFISNITEFGGTVTVEEVL